MNLREIISITGKPGLYKIVSQGNRALIVENLIDKKRMPTGMRDKVISLGDIAMYTLAEDLPLGEILDRLYAHMNGTKIEVKELVKNNGLGTLFGEVVENYDRDRVYPSDIKKLFNWYNILVDAGYTKFTPDEEQKEEAGEAEENKA